jgi:hypothetical protein
MRKPGFRPAWLALIAATLMLVGGMDRCRAQTTNARIDEALQNITTLIRAGKIGYATFWDGNAYVQCRRMPERQLRCEAAGTTMQSSLANVLTGDRLTRLAALGWVLDPSFGNYAQTFPADMPTGRVADHILRTLTEAYNASAAELEIQTAWIVDMPCPPRNGPSQNLAGIVNDAPSMRPTAVRSCSYVPPEKTAQPVASAAELIALYGPTASAEIQRLRINLTRRIHVIFDAGIGYVQCTPDPPAPLIYCEAQSAESWAPLAALLTPERTARLHAIGYNDPGRAPNYWKNYPLDKFSDAAIANEALTILHEVYGYNGAIKLKMKTE